MYVYTYYTNLSLSNRVVKRRQANIIIININITVFNEGKSKK